MGERVVKSRGMEGGEKERERERETNVIICIQYIIRN